jgi:LysM repeat protein
MIKPLRLLLPALLLSSIGCDTLRNIGGKKETAAAPVEYKSGDAQVNYIQQYKNAAVAEMERAGIPASIKLAQGLLESASGNSELARNGNNHFGIKCGNNWSGKSIKKKDDDRDASGELIESCFRKYDDASQSFFDHSEFLRDPRKYNRYGFLFNLDRTDYKAWARGLQASGYATSGDYADKLINLIERHQLYNFDRPGNAAGIPSAPTTPTTPPPPGTQPPVIPAGTSPVQRVGRVNDVKVVLSQRSESIEDIARRYRLKPENVANYNERQYAPGVILPENTRIYIQEKRSKWRGRDAEHFVKEGQSMFEISQVYGLQLKKLRERNGLSPSEEPATGERIRLKGRRNGPAVKVRDTPLPTNPSNPTNTQAGGNTRPNNPTRPATTDEDLPFEIDGGAGNKPTPPPPAPIPEPTKPTPPPRPSTTDTPFPNDPYGNNNGSTWQPPSNPTPVPQPAPVSVPDGYHLVVKGDTLYSLARKYGLTVPRLKQMNNMTDDNIKIGQTLRIR